MGDTMGNSMIKIIGVHYRSSKMNETKRKLLRTEMMRMNKSIRKKKEEE